MKHDFAPLIISGYNSLYGPEKWWYCKRCLHQMSSKVFKYLNNECEGIPKT